MLSFALEISGLSCFQSLSAILLLQKWSYGPATVGYISGLATIVCIFGQLWATFLVAILRIPVGLVIFPILAGALLGCLVLFSDVPLLPFAMIPLAITSLGVCHPLTGVWLSDHTRESSRARVFSYCASFDCMGRLAGSVVASFLQPKGVYLPTVASCALLFLSGLVMCPLARETRECLAEGSEPNLETLLDCVSDEEVEVTDASAVSRRTESVRFTGRSVQKAGQGISHLIISWNVRSRELLQCCVRRDCVGDDFA